ncbi:MAG: DUF2892 domain-containing protein [Prolixibacteraceae bacterium]|nr:DUF2892 domain-containing protein [Prolixibacteraceae bacterium]
MKKNVGSIDVIIRLLIAIVLTILYFNGIIAGTWGIVLLVIAGILLITSIIGFCPLYRLFKINTCRRKD